MMNLVSLSSVSLKYGARILLKNASLSVLEGDRLALVGPNGCGKTTLMKIMAGIIAPDDGLVERINGLKTAYLPQEVPSDLGGKIYELVAEGLGENGRILARYFKLDDISKHGAQIDHEEFERLVRSIEEKNLWPLDVKIKATLEKLELDESLDAQSVSAGLKRRVLLGRELVSNPDVLLLDEPTNHLDISSVIWLENFLKSCGKTCVYVSHDRTFLNNLSTRVAEVDRGALIAFDCGFERFLERRDDLLAAQERNEQIFDKKLAQEETWLRRGIRARRTRNEGRVRELMKLRSLRAQRVERKGSVSLNFQDASNSGQKVFDIKNLGFAYGNKPLIKDFSTTVYKGDKIGIVGANGAGKTTLVNLILGKLKPQTGSVEHGTRLEIAYFDQLRGKLKPEMRPFDFIAETSDFVSINGSKQNAMGYLQDFLFTPEQILGRISSLSGGEKNRLMLAKLFTSPANVLVLDEPTNDLDMPTIEILENALIKFQGTILLVSHDRSFLNNVSTCIFGFEGEGKIAEMVGGYDEWEKYLAQKSAKAAAKTQAETPKKPAPQRREKFTNKERAELESLPVKMQEIEDEQKKLSADMQNPDFIREHTNELGAMNARYEELQRNYDTLFERWAQLEERRENLEKK